METRELGRTGPDVSAVAVGRRPPSSACGPSDDVESVAVRRGAFDAGVEPRDTAHDGMAAEGAPRRSPPHAARRRPNGAGATGDHRRRVTSPRIAGLAACAMLGVATGAARAEEPGDRALASATSPGDSAAAVDSAITTYFLGEQAEGYAWVAAANASLVGGAACLASGEPALRGASYPLLAVGVIQLVAGVSSLTRNDARIATHRRAIAVDPAAVRQRELTRIDRVARLFPIIRWTEWSLLGLGVAGAVVGGVAREETVLGVGAGVAVEAAMMLALDHFAEQRALRYSGALRRITFAPTPGPAASIGAGLRARF